MNKPALALLGLSLLGGCTYYARGADDYRKATRELLASKKHDMSACYKQELGENEKAHGKVTVSFLVAASTGTLRDVAIVDKDTTANKTLQKCVLDAMQGLVLNPPDAREGHATFTFDFSQG